MCVLPAASFPAALEEGGLGALLPAAPKGRNFCGLGAGPAGGGPPAQGGGALGGYRPLRGVRRSKRPGASPLLLMDHCTGRGSTDEQTVKTEL